MSVTHTRIIVVLADQLARQSPLLDDLDSATDVVWMAESALEPAQGPTHQQRLVLCYSAMRHFREFLHQRGVRVHYHALEQTPKPDDEQPLAQRLRKDLEVLKPGSVLMLEGGDWQIESELLAAVNQSGIPLQWREDSSFLCSRSEFAQWANSRKSLMMEYFYRMMRQRYQILIEDNAPVGGVWNLDRENRESFGRAGPEALPKPPSFAPDEITQEVIALVEQRFANHPGQAADFNLPVTPEAAEQALNDFITHRLPAFGTWQDAIWVGEPLLYHSRLSTALNWHLLDPRTCIDAAVEAWEKGEAPLNAVEGFVRQILGWREFVRGIYWLKMPDYASLNALEHTAEMPSLFWDGKTDMACLADAMQSVLSHGYAHHIQRLMVLGLFAQLYGVNPRSFHDWHMAMYLDSADWVSLPNTVGMSQYGDGGIVGSKPYCASGAYIKRMSNACGQCAYQPQKAVGEKACPFTTLYWDFLDRHESRLQGNRRMQFQLSNLRRKSEADRSAIRKAAAQLRETLGSG